ncbi:hypothetical protein L5515_000010 [Caenorhabditis briggsae]|uniref:MATH domain-containing protein n=1 Tax=Caenorhabditis briggsae TaxID=6238 RepID=A0AAE9E0G7_CAEBR|nr:hypothetical protein L5515_000010 [Caenorhabditis briggsae]
MGDNDAEKNKKKRKFKKITEKLTSIEESISKIPKSDDDVKELKRIRIKRCDSYLRLKLCCSPIIPVADKWSIGAKLDFKVIGSNYKTLTSTTEHCFNDQVGSESEYIQWDDVEKFLVDDNLVVESCKCFVEIIACFIDSSAVTESSESAVGSPDSKACSKIVDEETVLSKIDHLGDAGLAAQQIDAEI